MSFSEKRAKKEVIEEIGISECEYEQNKEHIEDTLYFQKKVMKYAFQHLKNTIKLSLLKRK